MEDILNISGERDITGGPTKRNGDEATSKFPSPANVVSGDLREAR